ncbi:ABC transporter substrate-binding protein [Acidisphaera sp. L21]|uniref:ABC transporter substrate-binding protein n=1 Tax=Acidisphaera sp. L21 TaxID=1641851 RepID=UPI001C20BF6F|nr:ABC transporter substrate-binding protein [Acidisphaera sp. L21]
MEFVRSFGRVGREGFTMSINHPIKTTRRAMLAASTAALAVHAVGAQAAGSPGDKIRPIVLLSKPQASDPSLFQAAQLAAQQWRKLGLQVTVQVVSASEQNATVWNKRDKWDMTTWEMVGRPERSDPDELVFSLFNSSLADNGYDFVGYQNPEYDSLAQAQRQELDRPKRQVLVKQAQDVIGKDVPYIYLVYPRRSAAFNNTVWKAASIVTEAGIGIRNFWTFIGAEPLGAQKDMVLNCNNEIDYISPVRMDAIGSWVTDLVWDKLTRVGLDGEPRPWGADSFKWTSDTTMEVVVRDGMKFHDGTPITMEDVLYSFELPTHKDKTPQFFPFVSNIDSVKQTGPRTIVFTLKAPQASFPTTTLSKINLIPKHVWEPLLTGMTGKPDMLENFNEEKHVGSGPFRFVHWRNSEEVMLEANPDHWAAPKLARWILRIVPNQEATLGMMKTGEMNFLSLFTGDPRVLAELPKSAPQITVVTETDLGFQFLAMNLRRAPFDDPAFRRALSASVSRKLMAAAAYNGFGVPAGSCVSTALPFWHEPGSLIDGGDVKKSADMLKEAGYVLDGNVLHYPAGKKETLAAG